MASNRLFILVPASLTSPVCQLVSSVRDVPSAPERVRGADDAGRRDRKSAVNKP